MWYVASFGLFLIVIAIFGKTLHPEISKRRRLFIAAGVVMIVIGAVLPKVIEGFFEGFRVGQEIRGQGS